MMELPAGEESIIIFIIINFIKTKNKQAIPSHLHHAPTCMGPIKRLGFEHPGLARSF